MGTVRLFEYCQRPEHFSARRASQRPAHKPSNASRWAANDHDCELEFEKQGSELR